ncbi:MAG TPA: amidase, partial [Trueperaceae bacterium]|nr:amidase [Trueperaceae bacterium]
ARELAEGYLTRVDGIDRSGPSLNAVIELNPDALELADASDRRLAEGRARGPLEGVPVLLKDNIDTGDRMSTTAGSLALAGHRAAADAGLVQRLRAAGAVVLGKTNLSEWAFFRSTRGCSGWSSRGGQTRNPYALDRTPSGSSSGSAVAAAAGLCAAAVGTETDGSIVSPASANGVVGIKPTVGLVSRSGIIPVAASQDTAGPLARRVADAALLLSVMAGPDPLDPATAGAPGGAGADFTRHLDAGALRGARLGVARDCFGRHEGADAVAEGAIAVLRELGAEVVDGVEVGYEGVRRAPERELLVIEIKRGVDAYLAAHPGAGMGSLADVVAFNRAHRETVMPFFRQELLERAVAAGDVDDETHARVRAACRRAGREAVEGALARHRLDALVAPSLVPAWVTDLIDGDRKLGGCAAPAAMAGTPHVSVPAGYVHGLPVGLSLFAEAHSEGRLIGYAYAFEQAARVWRPPAFREHAEADAAGHAPGAGR